MKKYTDAIFWLAQEDEFEWLNSDDALSPAAAMIAYIFDKDDEEVRKDIQKLVNSYMSE